MRYFILPIVICLATLIYVGLAKPKISSNKQSVSLRTKAVGSKRGNEPKSGGGKARKKQLLRKKPLRQEEADDDDDDDALAASDSTETLEIGSKELFDKHGCWPVTDSEKLFQGLLQLEDNYLPEREAYHEALLKADIDGKIVKDMLKVRGGARGLVVTKGLPAIPAGLNLGAHGMIKMPDSIMMFYRMKLRNDTHFTVKRFSSNMYSMTIAIKLALNDLHLIGDYDRSLTENDTSTLYYRPTFGRVELLLKDATYMMEGRYRLLGGKLVVEHVLSNITIPQILMLFDNETCNAIKLKQENIEDYISRMQVDFDFWLKDYLSDYLAYVDLGEAIPSNKLQEFSVSKQLFVNQYVDYVIKMMNNRMNELNIAVAKIPSFRIISIDGTEFNLTEGFVEGLDTMYRRSVSTEGGDEQVRIVDADVSFSNLKVVYKYDAIVHEDIPQVPGKMILSGDELTAHLQLGHVREPGFADIYLSAIRYPKNESLIVDGAANRHIITFKHLLEHNIYSILSNVLRHSVLSINSLPRCRVLFVITSRIMVFHGTWWLEMIVWRLLSIYIEPQMITQMMSLTSSRSLPIVPQTAIVPKIQGNVETNFGKKLSIPIVFDALRSGNVPVKNGV